MAEAPKKDDQPAATTTAAAAGTGADTAAGAATRQRMGVRLAPVNNSDQPLVANYVTVNVAPGMAFIDFGFIEPGLLAALPRVAKQGGKLPESPQRQARGAGGDGVRRSGGVASADRAGAHRAARSEQRAKG